jgi:type III pantothenate kinase
MMLLIDAGNSRIKSGVWADGEVSLLTPVATTVTDPPGDWASIPRPSRVLVSNVAGPAIAAKLAAWTDEAWSLEPWFAQVARECAGVVTCYENPDQLGVDRWLAALGAHDIAAAGAAVVVDAGTATTIDVIDASGTHLGGSISPGVSLMVESLTRNTARLYLETIARTDSVATDTAAAISTGCMDAAAGGIEKVRHTILGLLETEPEWFITGGEAAMLMEVCAIEFRHVPEIVLRGLALAGRTP